MTPLLLMLEDDPERIARFAPTLAALAPTFRLVVWRNAYHMLRDVADGRPATALISLDHDLEPDPADPTDPGDGLDVARWLAGRPPVCPVVVHTSNGSRGDAMAGEFELGGWTCRRVMPLGDDWIEVDWRAAVRRLLRGRRP